ncbi:putrescine transporter subunit: ATP-binding component of ABC superfamily [Roseovarius sp. EC-HK134]|jgi:putrescine transport system ATP-binding protein|uniref:ABC transporter ATP-binding protein n=1 Tax=Roseovarius TaxID=74030 RepID=UPI001253CC48|nr:MULTISPECIES: ABC transporter ATP-binding protein [Roseovarius]MBS4009799.1 ABC transporter ATP-binding protein [Roseovarius sp.]MBW4973037.1 ABC transporter ATP-binding protein [Roseovarius mucosus]VVT10857.1 putrescine transporter subunit: ATP-binding component of ABC superfamily [Roseovarius sp. EC-HK134]VVT11046.1 putrescine transporter subunit: ATP-binding component of ABC superfamily [Roseovarius sp. EC-SD190]|tara:strand:- start:3806 stop:4930 length:1125 start_codon:yes stop_codon:yes gene_type:complete
MAQVVFEPWNDPKAKPLIQFKGVTKRFGDFTAIDNQTFDIYEREFFALLGPSGCGKTTMMRMLAGFEKPTEGKIILAGQDLAPIPPNKRSVNMMFQSYALFPHLSVWENIAFGLKRDGKPKDEIAARVDEMLKLTRLQQFAKRKPHQISGGQRQRVALARSLAKAPKLLLLDEPLGALDAKLRQATQFELMDIQEKTGTTFVIVTHDQEEAMTVASRVAVMDNGRIIQADTPARIYELPNSVYVADFIGEVTIIPGTARKSGEGYEIAYAEGMTPLYAETETAFDNGETCHIALRPEKVAISAEQPADRRNAVQGKIIDIAYLGNLSTYHVALPNGQMIKAQTANTRRLSRRGFTWEDTVWLSWTDTAAVLLKG